MFWEEDEDETIKRPEDIVDLAFSLVATQIPVEHAYLLSQAVEHVLPWLADETGCGLHQIHGAESGNGWQRPDDGGAMYISKRTKLVLRLPNERVEDAGVLTGQKLDLDGYALEVGKANVRLLNPVSTIYARYVITDGDESEEQFLEFVSEQLQEIGIRCKKMMCGRTHTIRVPGRELQARSLMLADISKEDSLQLQKLGLGRGRNIGCGLFIPHKGIQRI